jgi:isoleucyl-tRNA synthetase
VVLATALTPELIEEGLCRELVSRIQTMRKEAGFEVTDHIILGYSGEGSLVNALKNNPDILSDTLADSLQNSIDGYQKTMDINGETLTLSVKKINA